MNSQTTLNQKSFEQMEKEILTQVTHVSKSIIETFKFRVLYDSNVSANQKKKTLGGLKEFRAKNRNNVLNDNAYKAYLNSY